MNRKDLLEIFNLTKPAISPKDMVPIFCQFCFEDGKVTAYNGDMSITLDCDVVIVGGLHAATCLGILSNSLAKDVTFIQKGDTVTMKAGINKTVFTAFDKNEYLHGDLPDGKDGIEIPIEDEFITGIEKCLMSVSNDATATAMCGITVVTGEEACLLSTDRVSISRSSLGGKILEVDDLPEFILPADFCKALIKVMSVLKPKDPVFLVESSFVVAHLGPSCRMTTRTLVSEEDIQINKVLNKRLESIEDDEFIPIPKTMKNALKRSLIITDTPSGGDTQIKIESNIVTIDTTGKLGDSKDTLKLEGIHEDIVVTIQAKRVSEGVNLCTDFVVTEKCIFMWDGGDYLFLIANKVT